jgi:hypothetical protein
MPSRLLLVMGLCAALAGGCSAADTAPACRADADCVPATCCHPTACVPKAGAPDCAGTACTMDCRPGTLDCGGRCVCTDGRCDPRFP